MKRKNSNIKSTVLLLLITFATIFAGVVLTNFFAVVIDCLFSGFSDFIPALCNLPYLLYLLISAFVSVVFTLLVERISNP